MFRARCAGVRVQVAAATTVPIAFHAESVRGVERVPVFADARAVDKACVGRAFRAIGITRRAFNAGIAAFLAGDLIGNRDATRWSFRHNRSRNEEVP